MLYSHKLQPCLPTRQGWTGLPGTNTVAYCRQKVLNYRQKVLNYRQKKLYNIALSHFVSFGEIFQIKDFFWLEAVALLVEHSTADPDVGGSKLLFFLSFSALRV